MHAGTGQRRERRVFAIAGRMQFDESVRDDVIRVLEELNTKSPGEAGCVTYAFTADLG